MSILQSTSRAPLACRKGLKGLALIPCLLVLSLASMTAIGLLTVSQIGAKSASAWNKDYQARLAAISAKEIAMLRLENDANYSGDTGVALPNNTGVCDIVVTATGPAERTIQISSAYDTGRYAIESRVSMVPRQYAYTLAVCGDLDMKKTSKVLGDLFVNGVIKGETTAEVTGDVYLNGGRTMITDVGGHVIQIDGTAVPTIGGSAYDDQPYLSPAGWDLAALKSTAIGQGQYYTASKEVFNNKNMTGVVYLAPGTEAEFENVTIRGVLVAEPVSGSAKVCLGAGDTDVKITVKGGFFLRIVSDPAVMEDVAVVAPLAELEVQGGAFLDTVGCVVIGYGDFKGGGTSVHTGPVIINGGANLDEDYRFQSPSSARDNVPSAVQYQDYTFQETEYIEK